MKEPIFNIIFLPDTVSFQSLPLISLLLNTPYQFRLVGNALGNQESALLKQICEMSNRLNFLNVESESILPHGTLLDLLFFNESHELFCFMDPDIFAFEKVTTGVYELLGNDAVFSSCSRMENDVDSIYSGFKGGATTVSHDGKIPLASSFFCIYKRTALAQTMDTFGVGFEQYRSIEQIPDSARHVINNYNISFEMFDTGKLLSVLMHHLNFSKQYQNIDGLVHIGGMSGRYLNKGFVDYDLISKSIKTAKLESADTKFNVRSRDEIVFKKILGTYFYAYLNYLIGECPMPEINTDSSEHQATILQFKQQIDQLFDAARHSDEGKIIIQLVSRKP